jgi:hypothetical protein
VEVVAAKAVKVVAPQAEAKLVWKHTTLVKARASSFAAMMGMETVTALAVAGVCSFAPFNDVNCADH